MLNCAKILVAEDEPFIALDLALAIEDACGIVIGPVASVREALALIEGQQVAAAILDVNLADGDITAVVEALMALGIPLIVQTAVGVPAELGFRFPNLTVRIKPVLAERVVEELVRMIATH